jgi:parvulin-like peptidyl-prolyl isomerase
LQELSAGTDFDELAVRYDPVTGGELGWVPQGYLLDPNADAAVFTLQTGEVSGIIATEAGFHIFKAIERADHVLSPDALLAMQENALKQWLAEQREKGDIVFVP